MAFAGTLIAVALGAVEDGGSGYLVLMLLLGAYGAGLLAMRRSIARYHRDVAAFQRASSDHPALVRRYSLDEDGMATESREGTSRWLWSAFNGPEEADGLLLFWTGHVHGITVSVRGFAFPEEVRAALVLPQRGIAAGRGAAPPG